MTTFRTHPLRATLAEEMHLRRLPRFNAPYRLMQFVSVLGEGDLGEARAYVAHPVLGPRLLACSQALLGVQGRSAHQIFGSPDDLKLRSSMTLFERASGSDTPFSAVIDRYCDGVRDPLTLQALACDRDGADPA